MLLSLLLLILLLLVQPLPLVITMIIIIIYVIYNPWCDRVINMRLNQSRIATVTIELRSFVSDFSTGICKVFMVTRFACLISSLVCERCHNLRLYGVWDSMFMVLYQACLFLTWYWGEWISTPVLLLLLLLLLIIIIIIIIIIEINS